MQTMFASGAPHQTAPERKSEENNALIAMHLFVAYAM